MTTFFHFIAKTISTSCPGLQHTLDFKITLKELDWHHVGKELCA